MAAPRLDDVGVAVRSRHAFHALDRAGHDRAEELLDRAREELAGAAIWNVTYSPGGGLIDLLASLISYIRDAEIDIKWSRLEIDTEFSTICRRLYNNLYGFAGDGGSLGAEERAIFERVGAAAGEQLVARVRPGDIVFLHDAPAAPLARAAADAGAHVVWRCHVGADAGDGQARRAWEFLLPFLAPCKAYAFTRRQYAWDPLPEGKLAVIPASLDPFSPKNQELSGEGSLAILDRIGLTASGSRATPSFMRTDGTEYRIGRRAEIDQDGPVPRGAPLIAQVASWERLKDPGGLVEAFADHCRNSRAHLAVVGPAIRDREESSEQEAVLGEVRQRREELPEGVRRRVHLVSLPVENQEENAAMVNAIQRQAYVVVHKVLAEAFGLSVTEAMWKAKPVIAAAVGGISEQLVDGESGVLIDDPRDLPAFGAAMDAMLRDRSRRIEYGTAAKATVQQRYLTSAHVCRYLEVAGQVGGWLDRSEPGAATGARTR